MVRFVLLHARLWPDFAFEESVILLPPHGIQLETYRGLYFLSPLFSTRRFVPSTTLDGAIINEGLSGWNVLYYLALVQRSHSQTYEMEVVFRVSFETISFQFKELTTI